MFDLKGKTALVTGSGQGIGRAIALLLAEQGARVVVNWRSHDEVAQQTFDALDAMGANYLRWKYDLASDSIKEDWEAFARENNIAADILVLNASMQIRNDWENITFEEFDQQMHVNLRASLALIQACVPAMRERKWGRIVTIGSVQQYRPNTAMAIYATTKSAQRNLVLTLSVELAGDGITINNVAPGAIETVRNEAVLADAAFRTKIENSIPVGFVGQPQDIAPAVLLLCSEEGRYITGTDILVDGGMAIPFTKK
ncbi:MAG: SDR family oxidoreductase [Alistipes sp.]|nr:SDR family oxidoreductase [Alistipes sp.]